MSVAASGGSERRKQDQMHGEGFHIGIRLSVAFCSGRRMSAVLRASNCI